MSNPFDDLKTDDANEDETAVDEEPEEATESDEAVESESAADSSAVVDGSTTGTDSPASTPPSEADSATESNESDEAEAVERAARADDEDEEAAEEPPSPAETGPAFEYSDVQQKPFYARSETVTEFENQIRTTIVPTLANANVLDEETREIHDAVLRLANEEPERIAELVLEERRQSQHE